MKYPKSPLPKYCSICGRAEVSTSAARPQPFCSNLFFSPDTPSRAPVRAPASRTHLPKMLAVLAVGMGATLRLLRRPYLEMSSFRRPQG